jgi:hypothetical protein
MTHGFSYRLILALGLSGPVFFGPSPAQAQFNIEPLLDRGPIRFGSGVDVVVNKFGADVVATATANATLRNAQAIVSASLPQLNQLLLCSNNKQGATITSLDFGGASLTGGSDLVINVVVHVKDCTLGLYEGDVRISVPVQVKPTTNTIVLGIGPLAINPEGVYAIGGFVRVSDSRVISSVNGKVGPVVADAVRRLNAWVAGKLQEFGIQKLTKQYRLAIQSARLAMNGGDLALTVALSAQMSIAEANRRLSGVTPLTD